MEIKKNEKYLTIKELMEILRVSRSTIFKMQKDGLPVIKIGNATRYNLKAVDDWLAEKNK